MGSGHFPTNQRSPELGRLGFRPIRGLTTPYAGWRTLGTRPSPIPWAHNAVCGVENPGYADSDVLEETLDLVEQLAALAGIERPVVLCDLSHVLGEVVGLGDGFVNLENEVCLQSL